jgi:hypothetical protein
MNERGWHIELSGCRRKWRTSGVQGLAKADRAKYNKFCRENARNAGKKRVQHEIELLVPLHHEDGKIAKQGNLQ